MRQPRHDAQSVSQRCAIVAIQLGDLRCRCTGLDARLRATVEWYRSHRDWWAPKKVAVVDEFGWSRTA